MAPTNSSSRGSRVLYVGRRVRVCDRPQVSGEVVRVMPITGRIIVRLDPPHPKWRGALRSFRRERLVTVCY